MVFNATSNNISVILWRSVLLVEESGGIRNHNTVIGTDCIGSCKSNYRTITTMTVSKIMFEKILNKKCLILKNRI
jgi:hypothetical protein